MQEPKRILHVSTSSQLFVLLEDLFKAHERLKGTNERTSKSLLLEVPINSGSESMSTKTKIGLIDTFYTRELFDDGSLKYTISNKSYINNHPIEKDILIIEIPKKNE